MRKPSPAPSAPKLAYSEVPQPQAPSNTEQIARGSSRIKPPPRTPRSPARPGQPAPQRQIAPNAETMRRPLPPQAAEPARPAAPAPQAPAPAAAAAPAEPAPQPHPAPHARPRLTGPEWAAAAVMVFLVLAVVVGVALA